MKQETEAHLGFKDVLIPQASKCLIIRIVSAHNPSVFRSPYFLPTSFLAFFASDLEQSAFIGRWTKCYSNGRHLERVMITNDVDQSLVGCDMHSSYMRYCGIEDKLGLSGHRTEDFDSGLRRSHYRPLNASRAQFRKLKYDKSPSKRLGTIENFDFFRAFTHLDLRIEYCCKKANCLDHVITSLSF